MNASAMPENSVTSRLVDPSLCLNLLVPIKGVFFFLNTNNKKLPMEAPRQRKTTRAKIGMGLPVIFPICPLHSTGKTQGEFFLSNVYFHHQSPISPGKGAPPKGIHQSKEALKYGKGILKETEGN